MYQQLFYFFSAIFNKFSRLFLEFHAKFPQKISKIQVANQTIKINTSNPDGLAKMYLVSTNVEGEEALAFSNLAKHANTVFDIGANMGVYSLLTSIVNPKAAIYSFEPNPQNNQLLEYNKLLNNATNIHVVKKAVGEDENIIKLIVPNSSKATAVSSTNENFTKLWHSDIKKIDVDQISLDKFIGDNNIKKVDLIKLDVENYELSVLKGATQMLQSHSPTILMEIHLPEILEYEHANTNLGIQKDTPFEIQKLLLLHQYFIYTIGRTGILKVPSILTHPDSRNYIFSKYNTQNYFTPYDSIDYKNLLN